MIARDGKKRKITCSNTEGIFRIIQSIPSRKAEPFKRWLAHVGTERIKEIENPELAQERMKEIYEQKGYSKSWIDKRLRGIAVRQDLTELKGLKNENLRDHMTDLELIFSMLGEASTSEIERTYNPVSFDEHKQVSKDGGTIAKNARMELEQKTKTKVITTENYLNEPEKKKRLGLG
jgi:hypothetical protein